MRFQFSDGKVHVENGTDLYVDTRAKFAQDNGADIPAMPAGMASVEADGAGHVVFFDEKQNAFPLPAGHPDIAAWNGNALALRDKLAALLVAKTAREAAPQ